MPILDTLRSLTRKKRPPRALWIEDKPKEVESCVEALKRLGVGTEFASDNEQASKLTRQNCYDVILADLHLEPHDGLDAAMHVKELIALRYKRVVHIGVVTNWHGELDQRPREKCDFTFVYPKDTLNASKVKILSEDCMFAVLDSAIVNDYPSIKEVQLPPGLDQSLFPHVRTDAGYVLRADAEQMWCRVWRLHQPMLRTVRVFAIADMRQMGISGTGQPFVVYTFRSEKGTYVVHRVPLCDIGQRSREVVNVDIDLSLFDNADHRSEGKHGKTET